MAAFEVLYADNSPCLRIAHIRLNSDSAQAFAWALTTADPKRDPAAGGCLGSQGVSAVTKRAQNAIARRYVTTCVVAAPLGFKRGTLTLTIVPNRIRSIRFADGTDARTTCRDAVPARLGELLNLRDIKQALENFKRVLTVAADIQIAPAEGEGAHESDLVIACPQTRPVRFGMMTQDDSGSGSTGTLQAGATLSLESW